MNPTSFAARLLQACVAVPAEPTPRPEGEEETLQELHEPHDEQSNPLN